MHIKVKILGTKSSMRYSVRRLVTMAYIVLQAEYPELEVDIKEVKTEEGICDFSGDKHSRKRSLNLCTAE